MNSDEIPLAPLTGWDIAPISAYGAVMLRLDYLTNATQQPTDAQQTPQFVMTKSQALELSAALKRVAVLLESGPPEGTVLPRH